MLTKTDLSFLQTSFTFWENLTSEEQQLLLGNTVPIHYQRTTTIHQGDNDCIGVLLVKKGCLRVYLLSDEGKAITLYRLYEGDICTLSATCLMQNITFEVHIDAEQDSDILLIHSPIFSELMKRNIYVENFTLHSAIDRFSDVMWAMQQILFMSFDKRLAVFLIDECAKNHSDTITLTHEQIATYVNSAREVVSRMLKYFASEGWIKLSRGSIELIDKVSLRKLTS